jgi:hypothetical protein
MLQVVISPHASVLLLMEGEDTMKTSSERPGEGRKKVYRKPEIRQVPLKAEEAVLGSCKTASSVGPSQPTCNDSGNCSALGS